MLSNNAAATAGKGENLLHLGRARKKGPFPNFPQRGTPLIPGLLRKSIFFWPPAGLVDVLAGSWAKNALNSKSSAAPLEKSTKKSGLRRMQQKNEANQPGTQTTTPKFSMEKVVVAVVFWLRLV
jgi:hypothetical protein